MGRGWVNAVRVSQGAKKGKLFTKLSKEITVSVKLGGENPDNNARLRAALKEAQKNSMPKDTIDRAIKRGSSAGDEAALEEITYEGMGPHQVGCVVETLTDNRNRTAQDLRAIFSRYGKELGSAGAVMWMFDHMSLVRAKPTEDGMDAEEAAIEAGADDVELDEESGEWNFWADPSSLYSLTQELENRKWDVVASEFIYKPKTPQDLDEAQLEELKTLLEKLDENDDVKRVHVSIW